MDENLRKTVQELGNDIATRVNARQPLDILEEEMLSHLVKLDGVRLVISGYHRRKRQKENENQFIRLREDGQYIIVMNLLDGEENYTRNSKVYGSSLSVTSIDTGEHFSVVYDGLTGQILDTDGCVTFMAKHAVADSERYETYKTMQDREARNVFGLGRMYLAGNESLQELKGVSIRSLGSTTISILEVLRERIDIYVNVTKIWNMWWALWLPGQCQLQCEDIALGLDIKELVPQILSNPDKNLALACYRDDGIKRKFAMTLRDFAAFVSK